MKRIINFIKRCVVVIPERVTANRIAINAGNTSYMIILSFFPFFIFTIIILKNYALPQRLLMELIDMLFPEGLDSVNSLIKNIINSIYRTKSPAIFSLTTLTSVWLGSRATLALSTGLNDAYEKPDINYIPLRLKSILYILIFALMIFFTLVLVVFGNRLATFIINKFPASKAVVHLIINLRPTLGAIGMLLVFMLIYRFIPNHYYRKAKGLFILEKKDKQSHERVTFLGQLPGGLLSLGFWWVYSSLFAMYVNARGTYETIYGTMATAAVIMIWLYFCMYAFLMGGLLNTYLNRYFFSKGRTPASFVKGKVKLLLTKHIKRK